MGTKQTLLDPGMLHAILYDEDLAWAISSGKQPPL